MFGVWGRDFGVSGSGLGGGLSNVRMDSLGCRVVGSGSGT